MVVEEEEERGRWNEVGARRKEDRGGVEVAMALSESWAASSGSLVGALSIEWSVASGVDWIDSEISDLGRLERGRSGTCRPILLCNCFRCRSGTVGLMVSNVSSSSSLSSCRALLLRGALVPDGFSWLCSVQWIFCALF